MHDLKENTTQTLSGLVERITFHNPENGFSVLKVKVEGKDQLTTVIGTLFQISVGEHIECRGDWQKDKLYGLQFKANVLHIVKPNTLEGIEKYLASGLIKGVGAKTAQLLVKNFGENILKVLEDDPQLLLSVPGISEKKKKEILSSWQEQKSMRDTMLFLQSHGMSVARGIRIFKTYGEKTISKVTENPYRLAADIESIGFKTADELAQRLGQPLDSIERARAGIHYVLQEYCEHGHCAAVHDDLVAMSTELLDISPSTIEEAIQQEIAANQLMLETIDHLPCLFPAYLHTAEVKVAKHLLRLRRGKKPWGEIDTTTLIPFVEKKTQLQLAASQKKAIETVFQHKLAIVTGGPGVGKTTIVNSMLKILQAKGLSVMLCAPTGRAAKRLTEITNLPAKTIHRLLGFNPETRSFKHNSSNPLPIDVLVVDEASMIDIVLLHHLLKAMPEHAGLLFVGDVDQLPSVGPGAILMDMIRSQIIPLVELKEIFRQAQHSKIIVNAHRINQGELPLPNEAKKNDFYTIYTDTAQDIQTQLIELVAKRIPEYLQCDPITDIQVLTPMNRGGLGSLSLNTLLQQELNHDAEPKMNKNDVTFAPGDKVIQTVNNYDKEVFNGDIGFITQVNLSDKTIKVAFDQRIVEYTYGELDELSLAYAISIHKSQGSEFPVVIMVLSVQHFRLLARNLLYTGVTRGKRLVVLIGEKRAISMAVSNNKENKRITKLSQRLQEGAHI